MAEAVQDPTGVAARVVGLDTYANIVSLVNAS
jgi:hypothetical protein